MRRLYALIAGADPRQLEFGFALWTRDMVRTLIRREFNVSLSAVSVGRLLRTLGLSPQRPLWRAWQADPDAVERWKSEEFPAIRAQAKAEGATIYFGDEAGVRSDYHAGTTWAPAGQTPVVKATGARHSLNMISAVTARGRRGFDLHGSLTGARFIEFCRKLMTEPTARSTWSSTATPPTGPSWSKSSSRQPRGAAAVRAARLLPAAQPRRVGLEERQTRPRRRPAPPDLMTSRPRSSARCAGCRNSRTSSAASSSTPTFATSPRDQGPLTNELFSMCVKRLSGRWWWVSWWR